MNDGISRALAGTLTAQQHAYIYLQDRIVSGALPGGLRLKSDLIAAELGISRMPVREAIRQLDAEGYVTIRPNRGAIVTSRSPDQVIELFEIRAALEGTALRIAAAMVTKTILSDLEIDLQRMTSVEQNTLAWVERHDQFHHQLCATSQRPQLTAECRRYRLAVSPYVRLFVSNHDYAEQPGFEHTKLLEVLRSGDGERAERLMRAHVMANAEAIAACLPSSTTNRRRT